MGILVGPAVEVFPSGGFCKSYETTRIRGEGLLAWLDCAFLLSSKGVLNRTRKVDAGAE